MKEVKIEFENFLKELVKTYAPATETVLENPSSLANVGSKSRDYNSKAQAKLKELSVKHNIPELNLKVELSGLIVNYHGEVVEGHL